MTRTVVFLGAGASKALGLPLTNEVLWQLLERLQTPSLDGRLLFGDDADARMHFGRCLNAVLPGLPKPGASPDTIESWRNRLPPVTDVLSAIDHFLQSGIVPDLEFSLPDLLRARALLERGIFELLVRNEDPDTLQMKDVPDVVSEEWRQTSHRQLLPLRPPSPELSATVDWLKELASSSDDRVTVISTNYDIEVEQQLYNWLGYTYVFTGVDFGTKVRDPSRDAVHQRPGNARFGIYKLHGSLNWLRCSLCDNIYVNPLGAIAYLSFLLGDYGGQHGHTDAWLQQLEAAGANQCHCGHRPLQHVIVAPSLVRDIRDPILLEIWRNALEELRQADTWIIVGYSLPPEDLAIRSMLLRARQGWKSPEARGTAGSPATQPRIVVVQHGKREPELSRYQSLLPGHDYQEGGLTGYLSSVRGQRGMNG